MKSVTKLVSGVIAGLAATCSAAWASPIFTPQAVPEPDSIALIALGVGCVALFSRGRSR